MTRRASLVACSLLAAALLLGCAGTDVGNPDEEAHVPVRVVALAATSDASAAAASTLAEGDRAGELTALWIAFESIEVTSCDASVGPIRVNSRARLEVELVAGAGEGLVDVPLPDAGICRLVLTPRLVAVGLERADGTEFTVELSDLPDLVMQRTDGDALLRMDPGLFVGFELETWISDEIWSAVDRIPSESRRYVDATTDPMLVGTVRDAWTQTGSLYVDRDGDAVLSEAERLTPVVSRSAFSP